MIGLDTNALVRLIIEDIAIGNQGQGCATTLTFDRKAARLPEFQHLA